jgi:RNA-splicing ligase RtcB
MGEVKNWASILDEGTRRQAEMLSRASGVVGHVALMPDAHIGKGATVGSVIPTHLDTIIPAAVGVDIGCGMIAVRLTKTRDELPDDLSPLVGLFGRSIPAGVGREHGRKGRGESGRARTGRSEQWFRDNPMPSTEGLDVNRAVRQLGTLGSGNHFVEVCLDTEQRVWVVLHSGSRGIGNNIAMNFIRRAKDENMEELEDRDLAALRGPTFEQYIEMMEWAQAYAYTNREFMMDAAMADISSLVDGVREEERTNCHHNFAAREVHFGKEVWLTRKGAIKADVGDMGIIPGSMGAATYITSGLGNVDSYNSSAHGAGRQYSRGAAKRTFTVESLNELMEGKAWNSQSANALLDEHPEAYKPIDQVMEDQKDLTQAVHTLRQIVNYKGT